LARQRSTTCSSAASELLVSIATRTEEIAGGCAVRIEAMRLAWLSPSNALRPVAIS
jgi:hypothetical protein